MAEGIASGLGLEVVEVKLLGSGRKTLLRVIIDKPGGVTLDDCEALSKDLEAVLDVEDPIRGTYTLEVSSPGLDRPLKERRDFKRNIGRLIKVSTREKIGGRGAFLGRLLRAEENSFIILVGDKEIEIPYEMVASAKLEVEFR